MKLKFKDSDIEKILFLIMAKRPEIVLDSFLGEDIDKVWNNRRSSDFAVIEDEGNGKHLYIKGVVDGMVLFQQFLEHNVTIVKPEKKEN